MLEAVQEEDFTCFEDSGNISAAGPIGTPVQADMFSRQIKTLNTAFGKWLLSHFRLLITNYSSHRIPIYAIAMLN